MIRLALLALAGAALVTGTAHAQAQDDILVVPTRLKARAEAPMEVPFHAGEDLRYEVRFGTTRGEAFLRILGVEELRGHPTYHAQMGLKGGFWPLRVDYLYDTWMDVTDLATHRYIQNQQGVDSRYRAYDIYPSQMRWDRIGVEQSGETLSPRPQDQVSFLYLIRTMELEVGQEYRFDEYFKEDGNPVIIRVLRRETKRVPAGTFQCIVIEPIIQTSGLFGDGGQAEIYITDDEDRRMVYMKSRVPILPDIHLLLKEIR